MSTLALKPPSLRGPVAYSVLLHAAALGLLFFVARGARHTQRAPSYRVNLVAAPPGERRVGVVAADPPPLAAAPTPAPTVREKPATSKLRAPAPKPARALPKPRLATPNAAVTKPPAASVAAPAAGGGPEGGKGADVANVKVDGAQFPYQAYLNNIVRQIALNFKPQAKGALSAEVAFLIRRDGTVAGMRITRRSSVYSFDQDALAAVELASRAFGALPAGFADDVLPVIFSFDPRLIR